MRFTFDGRPVEAPQGMSIAAALIRAGEPAGFFCGIGICFGCLVIVNGVPGQRACITEPQPGDAVRSPPTCLKVYQTPHD